MAGLAIGLGEFFRRGGEFVATAGGVVEGFAEEAATLDEEMAAAHCFINDLELEDGAGIGEELGVGERGRLGCTGRRLADRNCGVRYPGCRCVRRGRRTRHAGRVRSPTQRGNAAGDEGGGGFRVRGSARTSAVCRMSRWLCDRGRREDRNGRAESPRSIRPWSSWCRRQLPRRLLRVRPRPRPPHAR